MSMRLIDAANKLNCSEEEVARYIRSKGFFAPKNEYDELSGAAELEIYKKLGYDKCKKESQKQNSLGERNYRESELKIIKWSNPINLKQNSITQSTSIIGKYTINKEICDASYLTYICDSVLKILE